MYLGALLGLGHAPPQAVEARVSTDPVIGDADILIDPFTVRAYISTDPVIGAAEALIYPVTTAKISTDPAIGYARLLLSIYSDEWADAGLPTPTIQGYSYGPGAALVRTRMRSGYVRQRARWTDGHKPATVSFVIPDSQLYDLEEFLGLYGYDWFTMGLATADSDDGAEPESHLVRVIDNPKLTAISGANAMRCVLQIEIQQ